MSSAPQRRSAGRPAGGSAAIVDAVFATTLAELVRHGYQRLSIEGIASAAGMNKTSIYRRWRTKAELVLAAIDARPDCARPFTATGRLRADLIALIKVKIVQLSTPESRAIAFALAAIEGDAALTATLRQRRYRLSVAVVQGAIERGAIAADCDPAFVSEMLLAPVLLRLLVTHEPLDQAFIEQVVDHVLRGIAAR